MSARTMIIGTAGDLTPRGNMRVRQICAACLLAVLFLASHSSQFAKAQTLDEGASFIKPFPKDEAYRLQLVGDWFAEGVRASVVDSLVSEPEIKTERSVIQVRSLRRSSWDRTINRVETATKQAPLDIAIVMFGAAEIGSLSVLGKRRVAFATDNWKARYIVRVDRLMKTLKQGRTAVYWLGMPTLRRDDRNDGAQFINEILRERSYINGVKFIDTYAGFADENGDYDAYGPDLTGKIRRLRARDGVYFTSAGYQKLAHFAKRIISRDLRRAVTERKIPLAGSELEQSRIKPIAPVADNAQERAKPVPNRPRRTASRIASTTSSAPSPIALLPGLKDQKADNSTISLRIVTDGVARTEKVEILRPAIPATVLALLTRRQSVTRATKIGDNVAVELPGGIVLLNSVTSLDRGPAVGARGSLSPTQSPFFKVWAQGERLTPRPGRADDIKWPRPEPQPVVRAQLVPQPAGFSGGNRRRPVLKLTPEGFPPLPAENPRAR